MTCTLCPRSCGADRASRPGFCGLGEDMLIARIAPHLWEEPPVSGQNGTGAVFFSGCTLRCIYCQNAEILGLMDGKINCSQQLSLRASGKIQGDVQTKTLIVEPGAQFNGTCAMGQPKMQEIKK